MAKKQNKTFAQRAKDIVKGYKRADFDPIEKAALENKLQSLQEEQESYKQINGMTEQPQQHMFAKGGYTPPEGIDIRDFQTYAGVTADGVWGKNTNKAFDTKGLDYASQLSGHTPTAMPISPNTFTTDTQSNLQGGIENIYEPKIPDNIKNKAEKLEASPYSQYSTPIAPSILSGATSALGNLYLANQQNNIPSVELPRISTPEISLERSRQVAQNEATKAGQKIKYAAKEGARTRGEMMANRTAGEAAVSGQLGQTLSASHEKEALVNANMKAGMDKYNAELAAKEEIINNANKIKSKSDREAYLAAAIGTIPQTIRDINMTQSQDNLINVLGEDYGWYMENNPDAKWYQRKKTPGVQFRDKVAASKKKNKK